MYGITPPTFTSHNYQTKVPFNSNSLPVHVLFTWLYATKISLKYSGTTKTPSWRLVLSYDSNSSTRFKNIKRFETELKWIKLLQTSFPRGFNDNIYHEGNISKMPDFGVLTILESRKRKSRSHGIRKRGNDKRKRCAAMKLNTSLNDLASKLREHGRHSMFSYLSSLPIAVLRSLDILR